MISQGKEIRIRCSGVVSGDTSQAVARTKEGQQASLQAVALLSASEGRLQGQTARFAARGKSCRGGLARAADFGAAAAGCYTCGGEIGEEGDGRGTQGRLLAVLKKRHSRQGLEMADVERWRVMGCSLSEETAGAGLLSLCRQGSDLAVLLLFEEETQRVRWCEGCDERSRCTARGEAGGRTGIRHAGLWALPRVLRSKRKAAAWVLER